MIFARLRYTLLRSIVSVNTSGVTDYRKKSTNLIHMIKFTVAILMKVKSAQILHYSCPVLDD
jgi:hypothetical protein